MNLIQDRVLNDIISGLSEEMVAMGRQSMLTNWQWWRILSATETKGVRRATELVLALPLVVNPNVLFERLLRLSRSSSARISLFDVACFLRLWFWYHPRDFTGAGSAFLAHVEIQLQGLTRGLATSALPQPKSLGDLMANFTETSSSTTSEHANQQPSFDSSSSLIPSPLNLSLFLMDARSSSSSGSRKRSEPSLQVNESKTTSSSSAGTSTTGGIPSGNHNNNHNLNNHNNSGTQTFVPTLVAEVGGPERVVGCLQQAFRLGLVRLANQKISWTHLNSVPPLIPGSNRWGDFFVEVKSISQPLSVQPRSPPSPRCYEPFPWNVCGAKMLAQRLTYWDAKWFSCLTRDHFLPSKMLTMRRIRPPEDVPSRLAQRSTAISHWVAEQIICSVSRLNTLSSILELCHELLALRNFFACSSVLAGIMMGPVDRLQSLWQKAEQAPQIANRLARMKTRFSPWRGAPRYRRLVEKAKANQELALPWLSNFLHDIATVVENFRLPDEPTDSHDFLQVGELMLPFFQMIRRPWGASPSRHETWPLTPFWCALDQQLRFGLSGPSEDELYALSYAAVPIKLPNEPNLALSPDWRFDANPPKCWSTAEVMQWLLMTLPRDGAETRQLMHFAQQQQWDGNAICEWSDTQWVNVGVKKLGHRKLLMCDLQRRVHHSPFEHWSASRLRQWMTEELYVVGVPPSSSAVFPTAQQLIDLSIMKSESDQMEEFTRLGFQPRETDLHSVVRAVRQLHRGHWFAALPLGPLVSCDPHSWKESHVCQWLEHLDLSELIKSFSQEAIVGCILPKLIDENFRSLGVRVPSQSHSFLTAAIDHLFHKHPIRQGALSRSRTTTGKSSSSSSSSFSPPSPPIRPRYAGSLYGTMRLGSSSKRSTTNESNSPPSPASPRNFKTDLLTVTSAYPPFYQRNRSRSHDAFTFKCVAATASCAIVSSPHSSDSNLSSEISLLSDDSPSTVSLMDTSREESSEDIFQTTPHHRPHAPLSEDELLISLSLRQQADGSGDSSSLASLGMTSEIRHDFETPSTPSIVPPLDFNLLAIK